MKAMFTYIKGIKSKVSMKFCTYIFTEKKHITRKFKKVKNVDDS